MADEPTLNFEEYRRRADADPNRVRCAKCGTRIPMDATRCPECGVHFQGEAFQFTYAADAEPRRSVRGKLVVGLLVAAVVLAVVAGLL